MDVSGSIAWMGPSLNCKHSVDATGSIPACRYKYNLLPPDEGWSPSPLQYLIKDTMVMSAEQQSKCFGRKGHLDFFGKKDQYLPGHHPEGWSWRLTRRTRLFWMPWDERIFSDKVKLLFEKIKHLQFFSNMKEFYFIFTWNFFQMSPNQ